jgi:hypothetical protein
MQTTIYKLTEAASLQWTTEKNRNGRTTKILDEHGQSGRVTTHYPDEDGSEAGAGVATVFSHVHMAWPR